MARVPEVATALGRWRRLAGICLSVALLGASCLGGTSPSKPSTIVSSFPHGSINLTIWQPFDEAKDWQPLYQAYQRDHKNITFTFKYIDPANYETDLINALAAGTGPDIVSLPNTAIPQFQSVLVPMPDGFFTGTTAVNGLTSQYPSAVATDAIQGGKVYGIPFYIDTLALFSNTKLKSDIFNQYIAAGKQVDSSLFFQEPADWTTVVAAVKLLAQHNGSTLTRPGIALGTSNNVPHLADITAALLLQQGVSMVTPDKKGAAFHLADPNNPTFYPGTAVLNFLKGFTDPASDYYSWNANQPDAVQDFIDGKLPMLVDYQSDISYIKQRNPTLAFTTTPFPQIANATKIVDYANYQLQVVTNNSQHPDVAWDFLHTALDNLGDYLYKTGRTAAASQVPATTTVYQRKNLTQPFGFQVPTAQSWYKGKDPVAADTILTRMVDQVTTHGADPQSSLFQAGQALAQLLGGS